jgi:hypothetical protein
MVAGPKLKLSILTVEPPAILSPELSARPILAPALRTIATARIAAVPNIHLINVISFLL